MKTTKVIAHGDRPYRNYEIAAWNTDGNHYWDVLSPWALGRGSNGFEDRHQAATVAAEWAAAHPLPNEPSRIRLLVQWPLQNYGIMEDASYKPEQEIGNWPNSPRGWDHAREMKRKTIQDFHYSNGSESTGPRLRIVMY